MYQFDKIKNLAEQIRTIVLEGAGTIKGRSITGLSIGGDTQFDIDDKAETVAKEIVNANFPDSCLYTEDYKGNLEDKKYLIIIDPIDGTRAAAAGLEMATIAIAIAPLSENPKISDVCQAMIMEIKSGAWIYADITSNSILSGGFVQKLPNLNHLANANNMFWTFEVNGHPTSLILPKIGFLIDRTANSGGVFIFNSATYSILKIITGQLDAYIDIGNRLLKDNVDLLEQFQSVGNGKVLHLFPYDIAAIVFIASKAGVYLTDAYGNSLDTTKLLDFSWQNQQSCIAASSESLHQKLLTEIKW